MEKSDYNKIAQKYIAAQDVFYKDHEDLTRQVLFQELGNIKNKKILDIGCGDGTDSLKLLEKGAEVQGIDLSKEMISAAKTKSKKINFQIASADKLPFKENEFDFVYSRFALHYLDDVDKAIKEIHRVLKKNGFAAILVPHPTGDYAFKNNPDYTVKELVSIPIYGNALDVVYPTHTLTEYLSPFVIKNFEIKTIREFLENPRKKTETGFIVFKLKKK
jgi:ubiquinone/menaquinone biosynthesis C-methylase UbiE